MFQQYSKSISTISKNYVNNF
uniref:Uncharacterized protein n=1 Tax=Arundo donax TaxID=35708 RepID=A0A0A9AHL0_ARUDO